MKASKSKHHPNLADSENPAGYGSPLSEALGSRRRFLKLTGSAALLGAGLAAFPLGATSLLAQTEDWITQTGFPVSGVYISPIQSVTVPFTAVGSFWEVSAGDGNLLKLQLRSSLDSLTFSEWYDCPVQTFEGKTTDTPARFFGQIQFLEGRYVQFRLEIPAGLTVKLVGINFIDSSAGPVPPQAPPQPLLPPGKPNRPYIISRADWGADESLRMRNGKEIWPKDYRAPKVMIVHHSETSNTYKSNPAVEVRGIYRYHCVSLGWGDIGYNYLIDWKGNIYEGRAGGDDVVGGHAYQYNYGSIGICLLGSFKTATPTNAMLDSLVKLLAWKASTKNINPLGRTYMINKTLDNICGHRNAINTTCPGNAAYIKLPDIRTRVAAILGNVQQPPEPEGNFDVDLRSVAFSPATVKAGDLLKIEAVIQNTGTLPLETQEPPPGFIYEEGQNFGTHDFDKQSGKFRLAVDFTNNTTISHPYRWGFGKTLLPGETVTVTGYVRMRTQRQIDIFGGVIQEYVRYYEDNVSTTRIRTVEPGPNRTERAPSRASDPNIIYFQETGHNLGYAFRKYWEQNGGLAVFGYPLTEEFNEPSPTEKGKSFIVQYFQRNRFEFHPEFRGTKDEVLLGLLGVQVTEGRKFPTVAKIANTPDKIYFQETGHTLGGAFYKFWKAKGGLPIFGYPISEEFQEKNPDDGKTYTVQYFERNRFEYHPEHKNTPYEVLLGLLGTEICRRKGWL